jgi:hypothetical protein
MIDPEDMLDRLHADLGWKRLRAGWAKAEIMLGLFVAAIGISSMIYPSILPVDEPLKWAPVGAVFGVLLFTLGGYLAMAGHRSHLYQSNNALAAWLAGVLSQTRSDPSVDIKELH